MSVVFIQIRSFIFGKICPDLVETLSFFIFNFCSRSRNFKIFPDLEKGTSKFPFQQLEELRAFWDKIKSSLDLKFRTMNLKLLLHHIHLCNTIILGIATPQ